MENLTVSGSWKNYVLLLLLLLHELCQTIKTNIKIISLMPQAIEWASSEAIYAQAFSHIHTNLLHWNICRWWSSSSSSSSFNWNETIETRKQHNAHVHNNPSRIHSNIFFIIFLYFVYINNVHMSVIGEALNFEWRRQPKVENKLVYVLGSPVGSFSQSDFENVLKIEMRLYCVL